jgi:hypothetical protein
VLQQFNRTAGRSFDAIAEPSAETCTFCPCVPFCEGFWRLATSAWLEECGAHVEGRIAAITESQVQGIRVFTFHLDVTRGTVNAERAFVEQVPESWLTTGGSRPPKTGELLRIVHGRATLLAAAPVIHVDRTLTSLWTVPEQDRAAGAPSLTRAERNGQSHA